MELMKIEVKNGQQLVSGRDLHEFLEINTPYTQWFERMCDYGFSENTDFIPHSQKCESGGITGVKVIQNHLITIAMAKELSMIQRSEKGKQARQYFIKCEEAWNSPEMVLARANQIQQKMIEDLSLKNLQLENKIKEDASKVDFYNTVTQSDTTFDMLVVAKLLNFKKIGRNKLFEILRTKGILNNKNIPYQQYINAGYFNLVENHFIHDGIVDVYIKTVVTQKGVDYLNKLLLDLGHERIEDDI